MDLDLVGYTVLVVEDCDDMWLLAEVYLLRAGATVHRAENGLEGLIKAQSTAYDAILMDMQMPVMGGLEATRRLRACGVMSPILALTTNQTSADIADALLAGCNAHLSKPCFGSALISRVASCC